MESHDQSAVYFGEDTRSEEVRDIIERMPHRFLPVTSSFMVAIVILMLGLGFMVDYPDTIRGTATLNSPQASVRLVMPSNGKIQFVNVDQKTYVQEGQLLAVVQNPASTRDVLELKNIMNNHNPVHSNNLMFSDSLFLPELNVGELNVAYYQYSNALNSLQQEMTRSIYEQQIAYNQKLSIEQKQSLEQLQKIKKTTLDSYEIAIKTFQRDSLLLNEDVISPAYFEKSKEEYLYSKRSYEQVESDIFEYETSISTSLAKIEQLRMEREHHLFDLRGQIINGYSDLLNEMSAWERQYTITSPIEGQLEFLQFWTPNQFINAGTEVFSVIPSGTLNKLEVVVPSSGVGKVKVGQKAIVKLDDYPFKEYGSLDGEVIDISLTKVNSKEQNLTLVIVKLLTDNISNYDIKLDLKYGMNASVDIITEDKKLISRLFEKIKYISN